MQSVIERETNSCGGCKPLRDCDRRVLTQPITRLIEFLVQAHGVEHALTILEQAGQDLVDIGDRKRSLAPYSATAPSVPARLPSQISRSRGRVAHEQYVFAASRPRISTRYASDSLIAGQRNRNRWPAGSCIRRHCYRLAHRRRRHDGNAVAAIRRMSARRRRANSTRMGSAMTASVNAKWL